MHRIRERDDQCDLGHLAFEACREHGVCAAGVVHTAQASGPVYCPGLPAETFLDACLSYWLWPGLCLCSEAAQVAEKWTFVWLVWALSLTGSLHLGSFEPGATWWVGVSGPSVWQGGGPAAQCPAWPRVCWLSSGVFSGFAKSSSCFSLLLPFPILSLPSHLHFFTLHSEAL